jgi:Holliday junction resolvasome RuvABC endonuclease subunit
MRLALTKIRTDGQTNARAGMDEKTLAEYADFMQSGSSFPPIVAFFDGTCYWLADGFHRVSAARRAGFKEIEVELKAGSARDAMLYAVGANATHGLKRSPADKRRAISLLLQDTEWSQWSDRAIAKASNTSHSFVAKVRASVTGNKSSERKYQTRHGTTAVMDVSNIGTKPPSPPGWLGLKPGLAKIKWAVLRVSASGDPYVEDYGEIRTPSRVSVPERLGELERDLVSLLKQFCPTVVALEIPQNHPDYPPQTKTIEAIGVIELVCYRELEIVPLRFQKQEWRSHLVDGRADAEEVTEAIALTFDLPMAVRNLDAVGIAYAAFCSEG